MLSRKIAAGLTAILLLDIATSSSGSNVQGDTSSGPTMRFEVASVRESPQSNGYVQPLTETPGGVTMRGRTVLQMMQWAYNLPGRDIIRRADMGSGPPF